jgi:hypothetical protein
MTPENFVLPQVSLPTLEVIIKAYYLAYRDGEIDISNAELTEFTKSLPDTERVTIQEGSGCVTFLCSIGILEKSAQKYKYKLTELGVVLGRAIKDHMPDQTSECWARAIESSDFIKNVFHNYIRTVRLFKQDDLIKEIVLSANRSPKPNAL